MSLRIAREEFYLLLPLSIDHAISMQGQKNYTVPIAETNIPDWVLNELKEIGAKAAARGLVIIDSGVDSSGVPTVKGGFYVAYSVFCCLGMKNGVQQIRLSRIEPVDFNLYWKDGNFYQQDEPKERKQMNTPTRVQMAFLDKIARDVVSRHGITAAELSRVNPFLQALLVPMSVEESVVKDFANDLFHALRVLPDDDDMNVGESNYYCALDLDTEHGYYLVIFNHPAIFDYTKDSLEGKCAYGAWKA